MQEINILSAVFGLAILIISVVVHETAHGYSANALGDPTAKYAGRLTLNPLRHLELMGSVIIPLATYFLGGFVFGWAKPVPYNPYNLKNQKWGPAIVAGAGPLSNFVIAIFFGVLSRLVVAGILVVSPALVSVMVLIVFINVTLAIFNLVPIPPLDGSKILFAVLPYSLRRVADFLERYGFFVLIIFIFFFFQGLAPIILKIASFFTGLAL